MLNIKMRSGPVRGGGLRANCPTCTPFCAALALRYILKTEIICNFFLLTPNMTAGLFLVPSYSKLNRKMAALLDIAPYILVEVDLRFRGINCLYDQSDETSICCGLWYFFNKVAVSRLFDFRGLRQASVNSRLRNRRTPWNNAFALCVHCLYHA
jgi:hypothetical protein